MVFRAAMYREYFGLKENPFSIAPDPHYFYMSEGHREALAHLIYGVGADSGFILLTGEVGTGKTMVCRCLIDQMPENTDIAFILNPKLTSDELLASICDEFAIVYPAGTTSNKVLVQAIYAYLLQTHEKGRRAILIIEEAQNLSCDVLEQIRLLTNLETDKHKLLQIIMLGQPELLDMLAKPELRQLSQRITARYHLGALTRSEAAQYVDHRLCVAGWMRGRLFPAGTLNLLYRLSGGIPRLINVICDRALIGAFIHNKDKVDRKILATAAREVTGAHPARNNPVLWYGGAAAVCVILLVLGLVWFGNRPPVGLDKENQTQKELHLRTQATVTPLISGQIDTGAMEPSLPGDKFVSLTGAYEMLFRMWNLPFDASGKKIAGEQAAAAGLELIENKGNLVDLRLMNKPVILKLLNAKTSSYFYVTLVSIDDKRAEIAHGAKIKTFSIQDVFMIWSGEYILLWKPPEFYKSKLRIGYAGAMVEWLDHHLAQVQHRPATGRKVYDTRLSDYVKEFQQSVGLNPDGIVGPMTIIYMQGMLGNDRPSLSVREVRK